MIFFRVSFISALVATKTGPIVMMLHVVNVTLTIKSGKATCI